MEAVIVKFEGIDSWYRPVFKSTTSKTRYGSTGMLCDNKEDAKQKITEDDLEYFGQKFDCEPWGSKPANTLKIDWEES